MVTADCEDGERPDTRVKRPDMTPEASVKSVAVYVEIPFVDPSATALIPLQVPDVVIVPPDNPVPHVTLVTVPDPLLLNVDQSAEERHPGWLALATLQAIVPVVVMGPPVIGAVVAILVTVPELVPPQFVFESDGWHTCTGVPEG